MLNSQAYTAPGIIQIKSPIEIIDMIVREHYGLKLDYINEKSNRREVVMFRQVIHTILARHTRMSLQDIGIKIGRKNHCTVIHSKHQVENAEYIFTKRKVVHPLYGLYAEMESAYLTLAGDSKDLNTI